MNAKQLRQLSLFASIPDDALEALAGEARIRRFDPGAEIFHEADQPSDFTRRFYFVLTGSVRLIKHSPAGKDTVVRIVPSGEAFGLSPVFADEPFPVTARAAEATHIGVIQPDRFLALIREHPDVAIRLVLSLFERLHMTQEMLHSVAAQPAIQRIARVILYFARRGGTDAAREGQELRVRLPHETVASMVGITYEESVRAIRTMKDLCLTYRRGGRIVITNPAELEAMAEG